MILPEGYEEMTDPELLDALVAEGNYDTGEAEGVVAMLRGDAPVAD